jgi:hypothetical protein
VSRSCALCLDRICGPLEPVDTSIINEPHLEGLQITDNYPRGYATIDILVGQNCYYEILHGGNFRRGPPGSPLALDSLFGWILCGRLKNNIPTSANSRTTSWQPENITAISIARTYPAYYSIARTYLLYLLEEARAPDAQRTILCGDVPPRALSELTNPLSSTD